jgi:uncharacterized Fe-S cluster-containing radical SAM superfamily protein
MSTTTNTIDTESFSEHLRGKGIKLREKRILITNFHGSNQEKDLSEPANCNGFGRIRHFRLESGNSWPLNPLPIFPAAKAFGIKPDQEIRAQVFQNSVCNWRCWYCFVDFSLLNGDIKRSDYLTCDELLDLFINQPDPPSMIDLTGGQPDLTPEWIPWMMEALNTKGLNEKIFLWSDDNLSNDYFWKYLSQSEIESICNYTMYARVCCFKGIDAESFSLNTKANPELFDNQFILFKRLLDLGIDLYSYITITANTSTNFDNAIPLLLDKLQKIDEMLPLRTVPLQILEFLPMKDRMNEVFRDMIQGQYKALEVWQKELQRRFSQVQLHLPITEITLGKRR